MREMSTTPMVGKVVSFDHAKCFGWIYSDPRQFIFAHKEDVLPDVVGRTFLRPGCVVEFVVGSGNSRGSKAFRIRDCSPETAAIDPETYQEVGRVYRWDIGKRCGFVARPDGDSLFVPSDELITIGEEDLPNGQTWIRYKVGSRNYKHKLVWFARQIEILEAGYTPPVPDYVPEAGSIEEVFLNAPELSAEPIPAPAEPQIYAPEERKMSLRALINRKKVAA